MSELILGTIILVLLIYHAWYVKNQNEQEKTLIRGILSKNSYEFTSGELAGKASKKSTQIPDAMPLSEMDDSQFKKMIKKQLKDK